MKLGVAFTVAFADLLVARAHDATLESASSSCQSCSGGRSNDHVCKADGNRTCSGPASGLDSSQEFESKDTFQCGIYLAESSIPNAGFGIYTTRDVSRGELIQAYPEAPSIPIFDFYYPFGNKEQDWNHDNYVWEAEGILGFEGGEIFESVMTFGSLCNFHTVLKSLRPTPSEYDDTILNRFENPGAGAISYHMGRNFQATRDIQAGEELFDDYGDTWLDYRPGTYADFVPRPQDYETAVSVLEQLQAGYKQTLDDAQLSFLAGTISVFDERAANAFPSTREKYERFLNMTNAYLKTNPTYKLSKEVSSHLLSKNALKSRDTNWIVDNGICLEKMKPGLSTISEAGRGAFAQVTIKKGEIIVPAPLLNIPNKDSLLTYESEYDKDFNRIKVSDEPTGHQLLLNYCFGHRDSKLLLCPTTNSILINHCSKREGEKHCNNGNGPNAKVKWASGWDPTTNEWLQKSMNEISKLTADGQRGLSLEIIATTDIAVGDEIFIDYGENWEDAWNSHVENWEPPEAVDGTGYTPLASIQKDDLRTNIERETNPYPSHVELSCYGGRIIDEADEVEYEEDVVYMTADSSFSTIIDGIEDNLTKHLLSCDIEKYDEMTQKYTVNIYQDGVRFVVNNFQKSSIRLALKRYSSDQHIKGAFRHFMEIDDEIFPQQWKNSL